MDRTNALTSTHLLVAAGAGALLMYLFDPQQGRRRTARLRDQAVHMAHKAGDVADAGARDFGHRTTGLLAELRSRVRRNPVGDDVLTERVRSRLGRLVSHPHAVKVSASKGRVSLFGPVMHDEADRLLRGVGAVPGVRDIDNQLELHLTAGNVPALQGGKRRLGPRAELLQANWAPGPRMASLAAGTLLAGYGFARRDLAGTLLGIAGAALAVRAASNQALRRTLLPRARRGQEVHKSIFIAAPRERVFEQWSNYDNFPRFMSHVEEVRRIDETRSHWVVKGPAGVRVEWDAVMTEHEPPALIGWCSETGAPVQHAGVVRFAEQPGGTRVTVDMAYTPPGGAIGHTLAKLLGRDPKQEMDADLMRMKSFIETGTPAHDAAGASSRTPTGTAS